MLGALKKLFSISLIFYRTLRKYTYKWNKDACCWLTVMLLADNILYILSYKVWKINLYMLGTVHLHTFCLWKTFYPHKLLDVILIHRPHHIQYRYLHAARTRGKRFHGWVGIFFRVYIYVQRRCFYTHSAFVDLMWRILWFNFGLPNILSTISIRQ